VKDGGQQMKRLNNYLIIIGISSCLLSMPDLGATENDSGVIGGAVNKLPR
jgi:hypothetical protein